MNNPRFSDPYRMTYEQAGHIFRALQFIPAALALVCLSEIDEMRLIPPDKNMRFDELLEYNARKLQLFDPPRKLVLIRSSGFIQSSKWPDEVSVNPDLDKWEYVEDIS